MPECYKGNRATAPSGTTRRWTLTCVQRGSAPWGRSAPHPPANARGPLGPSPGDLQRRSPLASLAPTLPGHHADSSDWQCHAQGYRWRRDSLPGRRSRRAATSAAPPQEASRPRHPGNGRRSKSSNLGIPVPPAAPRGARPCPPALPERLPPAHQLGSSTNPHAQGGPQLVSRSAAVSRRQARKRSRFGCSTNRVCIGATDRHRQGQVDGWTPASTPDHAKPER
mmetsp:Transcript_37931/g.80625  ORF Transcript_37931/g.80625 Transcript_37931/m.80625 type:complete len:224 (-) Transcript_37931:81-752(-)